MLLSEIKTIAVLGAGTMGQGIAQVCAMAGYKTLLYDIDSSLLQKALGTIEQNLESALAKRKITAEFKKLILENIRLVNELNDVHVELVIEAVVEKLEVKQQLFAELEKINHNCILASNTSSISIAQIASGMKNRGNCVGLHFFNPAHAMKLVEVVVTNSANGELIGLMKQFVKSLNKIPVETKDSPGFIVNRVARHFYVESLNVLEENVADVKAIDELMESAGFKMGPFRLMDLIGVDTNFSVTSSMYNSFHQDSKFRPNRIQQQKVDAGHWGKKTGKGFYDYPQS